LSHRTTTLLDAAGNVTGVKDANNNLTQTLYDVLNRATVSIDPRGYRTTTLSDAVGNVTSVKDADNNVTTFSYDADNRLISQTDPLGKTATFAYDAVGHMTATTDRLGRQRTFSYDDAGRMTTSIWDDSTGTPVQTLVYSYDSAGNMLTAGNSQGTYTMSYDAVNRVTVVNGLFGVTLTFTYDAVGNRTEVQDSLGGTETSTYDAANNLTSRGLSGIGTTQQRIDLTYDGVNQISTETRYSNLAGTTKIGTTTYLYDAAERLTSLHHSDGSGNNIANYTYSYDAGNRVTSEYRNGTPTGTYSYDADNELTSDGTTTLTFDGEGNRTNGSNTTGTGNQLTSDGTWTYSYDAEGNETKKTLGLNSTTWTYGYDNLNHLIYAKQWSKDPSNGGTVQKEMDYDYDVFGNLVEEDVYLPGPSASFKTRFVQDGWDPAQRGAQGTANWSVLADLDGLNSNALEVRYLRGDVVDQLFARVKADGTGAWYLTDRQGSVRDITDNTGAVKDTITYDAWGNVTSESAPAWGDRYKWTGRELDAQTGLQYNRARWYDPMTGRWTSLDPRGFDAGDSNLYRYVKNTPILGRDPTGFQGVDDPGIPSFRQLIAPPTLFTEEGKGQLHWEVEFDRALEKFAGWALGNAVKYRFGEGWQYEIPSSEDFRRMRPPGSMTVLKRLGTELLPTLQFFTTNALEDLGERTKLLGMGALLSVMSGAIPDQEQIQGLASNVMTLAKPYRFTIVGAATVTAVGVELYVKEHKTSIVPDLAPLTRRGNRAFELPFSPPTLRLLNEKRIDFLNYVKFLGGAGEQRPDRTAVIPPLEDVRLSFQPARDLIGGKLALAGKLGFPADDRISFEFQANATIFPSPDNKDPIGGIHLELVFTPSRKSKAAAGFYVDLYYGQTFGGSAPSHEVGVGLFWRPGR
jgi:RHS repeat-associated protein